MEERKLPDWMVKLRAASKKPECDNNGPDEISSIIHVKRPLLTFPGKVRYVNNFGDCCYICEAMIEKLETLPQLAVGFDLEWPVNFVKGSSQGRTALIQVCPSTRVCYLFHVTQWTTLPKVFVEFISHPKVRLVGQNIRGDIWKLGRDFDISAAPIVENNTVELGGLANQVFSIRTGWSLDRIVMYVLKMQLDKSNEVRKSNWSHGTLTRVQLDYAATDAYASLLVYQRLKEMEAEANSKMSES